MEVHGCQSATQGSSTTTACEALLRTASIPLVAPAVEAGT